MKKIILAAAIVLTTGAFTIIAKDSSTNDNNAKTVKAAKINVAFEKNVLANAD